MPDHNRIPYAMVVLDGFGLNPGAAGNAVEAARTPNLDQLRSRWPTCVIRTSGLDVGLPDGQMGNSEVGHTNIGAGRIVYQELTRISKAIADGDFFGNPALQAAMDNAKRGGALHLFGLLSDGGVHSHDTHLYALLDMAKRNGLSRVFVHCFFDGRDVPPDSALGFVKDLSDRLERLGTGRIATLMGRYYAMDRDNRWDRVERAYRAMTAGEGLRASDPVRAVSDSYSRGIMDEFVEPTVLEEPDGRPVTTIRNGDSVIFFNFRPDRAREITRAFLQPDFRGFPRPGDALSLVYVCMTQYDATFADFPGLRVAFFPQSLDNPLGDIVSRSGRTQLRIAETEKYAHVTFFFNGGVEREFPGEDRVLISSPKVATYDLKPEMSAPEVAEEAERRIRSGRYDLVVLNFANCDMVGHTGVFEAAVKAVETVDAGVGRVVGAVLDMGGIAMVTADHGNAEQMVDPETGGPFTAHTSLPVPLILAGREGISLRDGRLADLAPTLLDLMGLAKPADMTGTSLVVA